MRPSLQLPATIRLFPAITALLHLHLHLRGCDVNTAFIYGMYVPKLPKVDATPEFVKTSKATKIKHYIRQQCAHAILRVMASAAENGIQVVLRNKLGAHVRRLLFPRLYAGFVSYVPLICIGSTVDLYHMYS